MTKKKNGGDKPTPKVPPKNQITSLQFDLFGDFVTNDKSKVSNTIEIWERIPKYFLTTHQIDKLRTVDGHAKPYEWEYTEDGHTYTVILQPAFIKENGIYKAHFPSATEELIEEALKKILADQQHGIHDPHQTETWIKFSLGMLWRELKGRGRERNRQQIKHAIEVMSSCVLAFHKDGKELWRGAILQDLVTVGREEYLADTDSLHIARLPLFISHAINNLDYRQFNYDRLMSCDNALSRWIYKRLIHRYRQASYMNDYHFMYADLKGSGLLQQTRERDNRKKALNALDELVNRKVLMRYTAEERTEGRQVTNVKYTLFPSIEFVTEQKAANKRESDNRIIAIKEKLPFVDK